MSSPVDLEPAAISLNAAEREVIERFVVLGRILGQPRSVAEIYGLLFISPNPLSMGQIIEALQLSKGSASQGLRVLRAIGAVRIAETTETRRDYFEAETALKPIVRALLSSSLQQDLKEGEARLRTLSKEISIDQNGDFTRGRIERLAKWHRRARQLLPLAARLLGR